MIDNQDKQTQPLDLGPAPKRRGRPAKEKALSNACLRDRGARGAEASATPKGCGWMDEAARW